MSLRRSFVVMGLMLATILSGQAPVSADDVPLDLFITFYDADTQEIKSCDDLDLTPAQIESCVILMSPDLWGPIEDSSPTESHNQRATTSSSSGTSYMRCYSSNAHDGDWCSVSHDKEFTAIRVYALASSNTYGCIHAGIVASNGLFHHICVNGGRAPDRSGCSGAGGEERRAWTLSGGVTVDNECVHSAGGFWGAAVEFRS